MRVVIQRVKGARVYKEGKLISEIGRGLLVLAGFGKDDTEDDLIFVARKVVNMRIFEDEAGKMNLSLRDINGDILVVSQFTLYGDARWGLRPSFDRAAPFERAKDMYENFCNLVSKELGKEVKMGEFGAMMDVELINAGPVTILLDSKREF